MSDGAVANGSFVYDATTNTYSAINITTSGGTVLTGSTYTGIPTGFLLASATGVLLVPNPSLGNLIGTPGLELFFGTALTNAGGTSAVTGAEGLLGTGTVRPLTAGSVNGTPFTTVPTLSKAGLALLTILLAAVAALLLLRPAKETA
jgi:hypothetical protein